MSTIVIGLNNSNAVLINIEDKIPEHEHIWIWDHFFSLVLNRMKSDDDMAQALLDSISEWAVGFANKMYSPINELHAEGALKIDKNIKITDSLTDREQMIMIEVTSQIGSWPTVHAKISDDIDNNSLNKSVIALAHYFLSNNTNFFRELPMHVLGMRKFYNEDTPFTDASSISEAPAFAFNLALKFYEDLDKKMQRQ